MILPGANGGDDVIAAGVERVMAVIAPWREIYRGVKIAIAANGTFTVQLQHNDSGKCTTTQFREAPDGSWEKLDV